ncbi:MAG: hypothetical protein JO216_00485 [Hyphomicrobiales bacterium]|nr:hypothetical protein [Hyphomicrobiales bacterium]
MKKMLALGLTASVLLGAVPTVTTPASAAYRHVYHHPYYRHYGYYRHHRHYGAAPFVGAVGALIGGIAASEAARHYDYGPSPYGYYGPSPYYGYGPYGYGY